MFTHARRRRRHLTAPRLAVITTTALAGASIPALGLLAAPAGAVPNPNCTGTVTVTCVFSATGGFTNWPVPFGVTSLTVIADGGSGASAVSTFSTGGGAGGAGGEYTAALSNIHFPTTLSVFPGSAASGATGGANAAGSGGHSGTDTNGNTGGGGGGASIVTITPASVSNLLVVAGGGGGGSAENQAASTPGNGGVGGGSSSASGGNGGTGILSTTNGKGGTPLGGGNGGSGPAGGCTTPGNGTPAHGGNGQAGAGTCAFAGGGGGSGLFGGGGGGTGGGGGGGSAFPATTRTVHGITVTPQADTSTNTGDGSVTVEYTAVVNTTHLSVWSIRTGFTVTLFARLTANGGQPVPGEPVSFSTGVVQWCTNEITNNSGIASCSLSPYETSLLRDQFGVFSAYFGGDSPVGLPPASATGAVPFGGFFF